jgi:hypothetical protein
MSERERWMIYPLLFLSLGISLRSKITSSLDLREISCNTLRCDHVIGRDGESGCKTVLCDHILGGDANFQRLSVLNNAGKPRLVLSTEGAKAGGGGALALLSTDGKPELLLRALPQGGVVEVASSSGLVQVLLGVAQLGGFMQLRSSTDVPQVVLEVAQPGGVIATIDSERKLIRTLGVGIDQTGQITQAEGAPQQPAGESAPKADDKPTDDMPTDEKSSDDKPAGATDQPGGKTDTSPQPTDEPSTAGDDKGLDKP